MEEIDKIYFRCRQHQNSPKFETKLAVLKTSLARKGKESELKYLLIHKFIEGFTSSFVVNIIT